MTNKEKYVPAGVFWKIIGFSFLGGAFLWGLLVIAPTAAFYEGKRSSLLAKEALFTAAAGQASQKYEQAGSSILEIVKYGQWLREQIKTGKTVKQLLNQSKQMALFFQSTSSRDEDREKARLLLEGKLPEPLILAGSNTRWQEMLENQWNMQVLTELLEGKRKEVPRWNLNFPPVPAFLIWLWPLAAQLIAFTSYWLFGQCQDLGYVREDYHHGYFLNWHHLPWGKIWPVVGLILLLPGALPLLAPLSLRKWQQSLIKKRQESKKIIAPSVASSLAGIKDDDLLIKLRQRLGGDHLV